MPADRAAERLIELEPVLALLTDTHAECGRIVAAAFRDAERIAASSRQQAAALAADAQDRARAAREAALEQVLAAARAEASGAVSAAKARASLRRAAFSPSQAGHLAAMAVALVRAVPSGSP